MGAAAGSRERRPIQTLLAWLRPFLRGSLFPLTVTGVLAAGLLAAQAVTPLVVEDILSVGTWRWSPVAILIVLVIAQIVLGYVMEFRAHAIAGAVGTRIRQRVFGHTVRSRVLDQEVLVRSSVVSRHTSDVDGITDSLELTIVSGVPAVVRLAQSLILLTVIDWRAGAVMTVATFIFLVAREIIGRRLIAADRARLDARSRVSESVDESVSAAASIRGLRLVGWVEARFGRAAANLERRNFEQGTSLSLLSSGARVAGLIGLVFVVVFAVVAQSTSLAVVAAALLYVEAIVRSLEALPPWIRSINLAVVSRMRIEQILDEPPDSDVPPEPALTGFPDLCARVREGARIGIVTDTGQDADDVLLLLAQHTESLHVPQTPATVNAGILEHLRALRPDLSLADAEELLEVVALKLPTGSVADLDSPLGPGGSHLTVDERHRLTIAMALAARAPRLSIGPVLALSDADTASELLSSLDSMPVESLVVSVSTAETAGAMDCIAFVHGDRIDVGDHASLLTRNEAYAGLWERKLMPDQIDLGVLGLDADAESSLLTRLVTERHAATEVIYRHGDPADRILFIIAGRLEILAPDGNGVERRVATLGPGNHCGDLRLTPGERRAETVRCLDDVVVRSLSRAAISAGMMGLLDRTAAERRIIAALLRHGPADDQSLRESVNGVDDAQFESAMALLVRDGAVVRRDGRNFPVHKRSTKAGAADILDRIGGL